MLSPRGNLEAVIREAGYLRLREFLEYSLWFRRYPQLLRTAGTEVQAAGLLGQLIRGLDLDKALTAADAIGATPEPIRRRLLVALASERVTNSEQAGIRSALQRGLSRPAGQATSLPLRGLGDGAGKVLERYFFYDDADGVESFESFKAQYGRDTAWHWEDHGEWVKVTSTGSRRSVEIVANVPVNAMPPHPPMADAERLRRENALAAYLGDREPAVIVHRGHAYHVEKTLAYVTRSTRLVYLGSCRGLGEIRAVIEASPQADIISTRAVGTKRVNDPLLKSLNQAILRGADLDWPRFWNGLEQRFAGDNDFASYIPPHRNGAAAFMRTFDSVR
jgi:hypothetical protein